MNNKPLSKEEFDAAKAEALKNEPMASRITLDKIELSDTSYKEGHVKVGGKIVAASKAFFTDLSKLLHISTGMQSDLLHTKDGSPDGVVFAKMVEALKTFKAVTKNKSDITIIGDPTNNELMGITNRPYNRLPNEELFRIADQMLNKYPVLKPVEIAVNNGGMGVNISMMSTQDIGFNKVSDEDETFNFGFTMNNDFGRGTVLGDFAYRLICGNGMIGIQRHDNFTPKDLGPNGIQGIFDHINKAAQNGFVPREFAENMKRAGNTPASFLELEKAYRMVTENLNYNDKDLKVHFKREIIKNFFPAYAATVVKLVNKGYEPNLLTDKQKGLIITGQNMWDLINQLTWLGSNESGYAWHNQAKMRKMGGMMLSKEPELANIDFLRL